MRTILMFIAAALMFGAPGTGAAHEGKEGPRFKALLQRTTTQIAKTGAITETIEIRNEILSGEGAMDASNFTIPLQDPAVRFKLISARVINDGLPSAVKASEVLTTAQTTRGGAASDSRQLVIPFDKVKKGSIIEVSYQLDTPAKVAGISEGATLLSTNSFADVEEFIYVSEKPLKFVKLGLEDAFSFKYTEAPGAYTVKIAATDTGRKLAGTFTRLTTFSYTTAESWQQINKAFTPKYETAIKTALPAKFAAIAAKAKELQNPAEQIQAVNKALQTELKYAAGWKNSLNEYFPAGHAAVEKRGYGDSRDFAVLSAAILRQLGFTAEVALTFRRSPYFTQKFILEMTTTANPSYFNHALVRAKDATGKIWWVDSTNPVTSAEVLADDLLASYALVLDGKAAQMQDLPAGNSEPSRMVLRQTLKAKPDLSIETEGTLTVNASANNMLEMMERAAGADAVRRTLGLLLYREMPPTLDYKVVKSAGGATYTIRTVVNNWVRERTAISKHIPVNSPLRFSPTSREGREDFDFGQAQEHEFITLLKGQSAVDPVDQACILRSRWLDFDRKVTLKGKDTEVHDHLRIKERFVTGDDFKGEEFKGVLADAEKCAAKDPIQTFKGAPLNPEEAKKLDALMGPPLEKMTDADADKFAESRNIPLRDYLLKKRYLYYLGKIEKDPKDLTAFAKIAAALTEIGFVSGNQFNPGFLNAAMAYVNQGMAAAGDTFNAPLVRQRSTLYSHLGKQAEAVRDFTLLMQKEPNQFETAMLGYDLTLLRKNYPESEKWLTHALAKAATPAQKRSADTKLALIFSEQGKHAEALAKFEASLKDPEASAWDWHNAATERFALKEFDKTIEYEKKAIALTDFPAARERLAAALSEKARLKTGDEAEALFLEALKWAPKDLPAHLALIDLRLEKYAQAQKLEDLEKAKLYIQRTAKLQAGSAELVQRMDKLQSLSQGKAAPAARVPSSK